RRRQRTRGRRTELVYESPDFTHRCPCSSTAFGCGGRMSALSLTGSDSPTRLTLASALGGDDLHGAWWPHSGSVAPALPELIDALREPLGQVIDIAVNWSALDGVLDLDSLTRRGIDVVPGRQRRQHRVMT